MSITATCLLDLNKDGTFEVDVSQYLVEARVTQGRKNALEPMEPAEAIIKLNNADGRFSPKNVGAPYYGTFDDQNRGIRVRAGADLRTFTGYIVDIVQDPYIDERTVTVTCVDRLGLLARQLLKMGRMRQQPVSLAINRVLDLLEKGEEITNPGGENGLTTGWSGLAGATISAPQTTPFEGDYSIEAICDGGASGQGVRYDLGANCGTYRRLGLFARLASGDGNATLTLQGKSAAGTTLWSTTMDVVDTAWTYKGYWSTITGGHRYIELITGSALGCTMYVDCLHQVSLFAMIPRTISAYIDAVAELIALYDAHGLDALESMLATEAAGFAWMGGYGATSYGTAYASCQAARDATTTPVATWADDGTGAWYTGFRFKRSSKELISEARVKSDGTYGEGDAETTIWSLSPIPLTIPATETAKIKVSYGNPVSRARLVLPLGAATPTSWAISGSDRAGLGRSGTSYPPASTTIQSGDPKIGQHYVYVAGFYYYLKYRGYLRTTGTADIPDGDTVTSATLRLKILGDMSTTTWTLEVRQPSGSPYDWSPIDTGDWRATPGSDALLGSAASGDFPAVGGWLEIDIDPAHINKTGVTAFYLVSNRDRTDSAPTGPEYVVIGEVQLLVEYAGGIPLISTFVNYGVGADIEVTAGASDQILTSLEVKGMPYSQGAEESLVVDEPASLPDIPNPLEVYMPHQATRSVDMVAEAARLATRYGAPVDRCEVDFEDNDAPSLAQMQSRQINDLVTVKNIQFAHSSKINGDFFIEGIDWRVSDQGKVLTATFYLEQK